MIATDGFPIKGMREADEMRKRKQLMINGSFIGTVDFLVFDFFTMPCLVRITAVTIVEK